MYYLFGGGGKVSVDTRGITVCFEVGFGYGAGADLDIASPRPGDGTAIGMEAGGTILGADVGGKVELNSDGQIVREASVSVWGLGERIVLNSECGVKLDLIAKTNLADILIDGVKPSIQAKISGEVCREIIF